MRSETNPFRAACARNLPGALAFALMLNLALLLSRSLIDPWAI
jgi:hypothetical protein